MLGCWLAEPSSEVLGDAPRYLWHWREDALVLVEGRPLLQFKGEPGGYRNDMHMKVWRHRGTAEHRGVYPFTRNYLGKQVSNAIYQLV